MSRLSEPLRTLDDVKERAKASTNYRYFFSKDTLYWWSCRVSDTTYPVASTGGCFFVMSTRDRRSSTPTPRYYCVRYMSPDGRIHDETQLMAYKTGATAHRRAHLAMLRVEADPTTAPGYEAREGQS